MTATRTRLVLTDRPKSRLGTPQHTGPYSHLRLDLWTKLEQGHKVMELVWGHGYSMRAAADALGLSRMTAWRRFWFALDWLNAGQPFDTIPHQRSTRAVPSGQPILLPRDAPEILRQLIEAGVDPEVIAASDPVIPRCIRDLAARMVVEALRAAPAVPEETRAAV